MVFKYDVVNAILERLTFEEVVEYLIENLGRDLTEKELDEVSDVLQNVERLIDKYI